MCVILQLTWLDYMLLVDMTIEARCNSQQTSYIIEVRARVWKT